MAISDRFLYIHWDDSSTAYVAGIRAYDVVSGPAGLKTIGDFASRGGWGSARLVKIALHPRERVLYAVEAQGSLVAYRIAHDGALEQMAEPAFVPGRSLDLVLHPGGRFLFALSLADAATRPNVVGFLSAYSLDPSGRPALMTSVALSLPLGLYDVGSARLVADPTGRFLFVSATAGIETFTISGGSGSPASAGLAPGERAAGSMAVDPSGRYLYASRSGYGDPDIQGYAIDGATGHLETLGNVGLGGGAIVFVAGAG